MRVFEFSLHEDTCSFVWSAHRLPWQYLFAGVWNNHLPVLPPCRSDINKICPWVPTYMTVWRTGLIHCVNRSWFYTAAFITWPKYTYFPSTYTQDALSTQYIRSPCSTGFLWIKINNPALIDPPMNQKKRNQKQKSWINDHLQANLLCVFPINDHPINLEPKCHNKKDG